MADKLITLSLGGQDRILDIGKFWFTKFYGEITKGDPISSTQVILDPSTQFDWVVAIVYAGLKCHAKVTKVELNISKEDVENWIGEKEADEITIIIKQYADLNKSDTPGEP